MPSPEIKFDVEEQLAFDRAFPPSTIQAFEEEGIDDWIGIFDALKAFQFPEIKPEAREFVIDLFFKNRYGPQITRKDTPEGVVVYRRNISPLLRASQDVFKQIFDVLTDEYKETLNKVFSTRLENAERDWQK
jgi:hypothetical protein